MSDCSHVFKYTSDCARCGKQASEVIAELEAQLNWVASRVVIDRWGIGLPCGNTKVDISEQRIAIANAALKEMAGDGGGDL